MAERRYPDSFASPANTGFDRLNRYMGPVLLGLIGLTMILMGIVAAVSLDQPVGWYVALVGIAFLALGAGWLRSRNRRVPDGAHGSEPYVPPHATAKESKDD